MKPAGVLAPLLFLSGACALVYQVAWVRELRLVFGASTAASAAVLAIFMGGLGAGGALLGRRADRSPAPLLLYARLELLVAVSAASTPLLAGVVRRIYVGLGGSSVLGAGAGTAVRLGLAALVLAPPTLLMGGTLPAAARAAARDDDRGRRDVAFLYGANTLGAVAGALLASFVMLEFFGTRLTLWLACLTNVVVALGARAAAQAVPAPPGDGEAPSAAGDEPPLARPPRWFVPAAAAIVGFAFLLMEIVWYRMLAPVLGGSSYTFGLVLAVALLGVGLGGAARAAWGAERPATLRAFALTCALEALALAVPHALGDRVAVLALLLRPLGGAGLPWLAAGWAVVAGIVVLPAAIVAGWQFPLLVALLGSGGRRVGRDVGAAYAWNTAGAIAGSLAGGFGLLPALGAPGVWRAVVALLGVLGLCTTALSFARRRRALELALPVGATLAAALLLTTVGPTAAWRHSAIGAGREGDEAARATPRRLRDWMHRRRRELVWEADGVESSVALARLNGHAFVINGKVDGHLRADAGTQVMAALLGAILHPRPSRALVIGLGTGSSAGWLAAAPSVERVDVIELEPAVLRVARAGALVNHGALDNPKLAIRIGDAREVLLTTRERYDVIASEPSNPYRAGVVSLFTQEFYRAVSARLGEGGVFLQWLQAYEIDDQALYTAYATLASVFPIVETWTTGPGDLLLVGAQKPLIYDVPALRERIAGEPFRSAMQLAWRADDVEGLFARFVADSRFAQEIARDEGEYLNTDDRTLLEFAFARTAGRAGRVDADLFTRSRARGTDRPAAVGGPVDWVSVEDQRMAMSVAEGRSPAPPAGAPHEQQRRAEALSRYLVHDMVGVVATWQSQPRPPSSIFELEMMGEALADLGDRAALPVIERLRATEPAEADALLARLRFRQGRHADAADALVAAFVAYRTDPWPDTDVMRRALLDLTVPLAQGRDAARRMFDALGEPFALALLDGDRQDVRLQLAERADFEGLCREALRPFEPYPPWREATLVTRVNCYRKTGSPLVGRAERDLEEFVEQEGRTLSTGLISEEPGK